MKTTRFGLTALAAGFALGLAPLAATADDLLPPDGLAPIVGMAYDGEALWLAGASANDGVVVNQSKDYQVTFGGRPTSVQALAWSEGRLWIADIGDQTATRDYVVAFRLGSTEPGRTQYNAFDFRYEDGPRDAKAFLISGRGRIYVVSAGENPGIYRAPLSPSRQAVNTLERVADAPAGVTDGAFLADGSTMALRTATGIEYVNAFTWDTVVTDTIEGGPDGESITQGPAGDIYVGGNPAIRTTVQPSSDVTTTVSPAPTEPSTSPSPDPSSSPSGSSTPTAGGTAAPVDEPADDGAGPSRSGTIIALVLAGMLALGAGAAAFLIRR
ncbi:MAG: hypothetical protein QM713_12055 [Arachnia sp.]